MSLLQAYRNLPPRARAGLGLGLLAWGAVGLHLSDRAEERFGLAPTEADREALKMLAPRIVPVDRQPPPPTAKAKAEEEEEQQRRE